MACIACVNKITALSDIVGMGIRTKELMLKLSEKRDCVRKCVVNYIVI